MSTIDHLMGALYGTGVDNVLIEIDNQEVGLQSEQTLIDNVNQIIS